MQPTSGADWTLLARYITRECTPDEAARLEEAMAEDAELAQLVEDLRKDWQMAGRPIRTRDVERAWQDLMLDARMNEPASRDPHRSPVRRNPRRRPSGRYGIRLAIVMAFALTASLIVLRLGGWDPVPAPEEVAQDRVYTVDRGVRATINLTDGTHVYLNSESELVVDAAFGQTSRHVRLRGEGFFDVHAIEGQPFIIEAGDAIVEVRGTAFSVRVKAGGETVVAVSKGEVALSSPSSPSPDTVLLHPQSLGIVGNGTLAARHGVDLTPYFAWREGRLLFRNASFDEVRDELERWYNLDVVLLVPPSTVDVLNASFTNEPLSEILNSIAVVLDLKYTRDHRTITFYR